MSAKVKSLYICTECGFESPRWYGKCPGCGHWNTLAEQEIVQIQSVPALSASSAHTQVSVTQLGAIDSQQEMRRHTGLSEFDRVLGGGVVDGSVVLLAGDPGIGKSTILLQVCKTFCASQTVLYVAGEESPRQIGMRAKRLGLSADSLYIAPVTDIEAVLHTVLQVKPNIVMVDSIQTMSHSALSSSCGSVVQVRECAQLLLRAAKSGGFPVFLVGHVNKDGGIAGPKVLEHMVDVVLYFEGDRQTPYRVLRAAKNRFGPTNEIGVFEMGEEGLSDVENPSRMMLVDRPVNVSGTCVACVMEGSRPILAEVQALVSKTSFGNPRRTADGFDFSRALLLIAVLEKRGGYFFGNLDVYVNIVGGLRLDEPAADLPVALALVSNLLDRPIPENLAAFGEIGLAGEVRSVVHLQARINECARLGFSKLIVPKASIRHLTAPQGVEVVPVQHILQAIAVVKPGT